MRLPRVLLLSGLAAWTGVSVTTVLTALSQPRLMVWAVASVLFVGAFICNVRAQQSSLVLLAVQSASVITMVALLCNGYEGLLLVLIAAQLALRASERMSLVWIAIQTAALAIAVGIHWAPPPAVLLTPPYLGFQILMFYAVRLYVDEHRMRQRLAGVQAELAEKSRVEERLRIAQDLHDSLGHHLVALNLNLELAAHESPPDVQPTIRSAQALTRALLAEVKGIVRSSKDDAPVDLQREIQQLADELPHPKLHLTCSPDLNFGDARTGRTLLRAVQEIVTNAIRHGEASNVWIAIERTPTCVRLEARDDGRVSGSIAEGFGLRGMRRRLEELGGTFSAAPSASGGFEVHAELPCT